MLTKIKECWQHDKHLQTIITTKEQDAIAYDKFEWHNGQQRKKGRLVITDYPQLQEQLLISFHNSALEGHLRVTTITKKLATMVY